MNIRDDILFEDKDILVCRKKAGMPVESASVSSVDMISLLRNYLMEKKHSYIGMVHRLDQPVQGVIVFAKSKKAASDLSRQINAHTMKKEYLAVTARNDSVPEKGKLEHYLVKDAKNNCSRVTDPKDRNAKKAVLSYEILKKAEDRMLVKIDLETGRHHQIRVQMAHTQMALFGDRKYNPNEAQAREGSIALCAHRLVFIHPEKKKQMEFLCEPEGNIFADLMRQD